MSGTHTKFNLIAFAGYAGAGKDEAAKPLIDAGFARHCFGDIIKRQLNPLVEKHFGFSALTENRLEKAKIRRTLEMWGEDNYEGIFSEFFSTLPERCVNTRLVRVNEAKAWAERGGVIVMIERPGNKPVTQWEADRVQELLDADLVHMTITNDCTVADLHSKIRRTFL